MRRTDMVDKEQFIAALLPLCDTVCEYDKCRGKLRVRKTNLTTEIGDGWYKVEEVRDIFRQSGGVRAEKDVWTRYLTDETLRGFFKERANNETFRMRFRQGGAGYRQYDIRIDKVNDELLVIAGRDTQNQELDELTGALSRNHYQRDMYSEVIQGGVALVDMDDLKVFNDSHGHDVGDTALRVLAEVIRSCMDERGSLVRYGGDEFLVIAPGMSETEFTAMLGNVQRKLAARPVPGCESERRVTVSMGCVMAQHEMVSEAVTRADRLMYRAKRVKNTVVTERTPDQGEQLLPRILVVDDAYINRVMLKEMLSGAFTVLEGKNGLECMERLEKHGADISLVLLDINMPLMDGIQVLEQMNARGYIDDIPVVMITADNSEEKMQQAYELGVTDYIERPFDTRIVRRRVMNAVKLYARQRRLSAVLTQQMRRQERTMELVTDVLSRVMGIHNGEGDGHARHVQQVTERLLERLLERTDKYRLTRQDCRRYSAAAIFHDIGKVSIPAELLNKRGKLTPEEYGTVQRHTLIGEEILRGMKDYENEPLIRAAMQVCRWHHERVDGKGYPDGLAGEQIPVGVQAVGLADVFDALMCERPYKAAYTRETALEMIRQGACGAFDPLLLECLEDIQDKLCREVYES